MRSKVVLQLLEKKSGFVSGEALSRDLGVSRAAIWKHIAALRESGYGIEAVQSRGYRLTAMPDLLDAGGVSAHLRDGCIGSNLVCLSQTASTNADAFRLADDGAAEGTVVLADAQSAGKGRRGRVWASPAGCNLYCSVVLRPRIMPHEAPQLTFLSAVAVARAIESTSGLAARIKWPNDVLIAESKVAGLLNEMSAETDGINFIILGIGVNLNMTANQFPSELRYPAKSLFLESGTKVNRTRFAAALLNELDDLYRTFIRSGFDPVRQEWQQRSNASGRMVVVSDGDSEIDRGSFAGIDLDGALLLLDENGVHHRILCGDVRVI